MSKIEAIMGKLLGATPEQLSAVENALDGQQTPQEQPPQDTAVITQAKAAQMLECSLTTIYRLLNKGFLVSVQSPSGQRKVSRQSVRDYSQGKGNICRSPESVVF